MRLTPAQLADEMVKSVQGVYTGLAHNVRIWAADVRTLESVVWGNAGSRIHVPSGTEWGWRVYSWEYQGCRYTPARIGGDWAWWQRTETPRFEPTERNAIEAALLFIGWKHDPAIGVWTPP